MAKHKRTTSARQQPLLIPDEAAGKVKPTRNDTTKVSPKGFATAADLLSQYQLVDKGGHISQEYQDYGYRLAVALEDLAHKSLYIKMAKETDRLLLDAAWSFVTDANARNRARLFMWKLKQLKAEKKDQAQKRVGEKSS